jgi:hypothetical protein
MKTVAVSVVVVALWTKTTVAWAVDRAAALAWARQAMPNVPGWAVTVQFDGRSAEVRSSPCRVELSGGATIVVSVRWPPPDDRLCAVGEAEDVEEDAPPHALLTTADDNTTAITAAFECFMSVPPARIHSN